MHVLPIFKRSEVGLSKLAAPTSSPGFGPRPIEVTWGGKRKSPSVIGPDLTIKGDLISKGELQVDGEVHGDIQGTRVVIGKSAHIAGGIIAEEIIIHGQVVGSVRGNVVTLQSTSRVEGNIFHRAFAMERGASFEGTSHCSHDPLADPSKAVPTIGGSGNRGSSHLDAIPRGFLRLTDQPIFSRPTSGTRTEHSPAPKGHADSGACSLPPIGARFGPPSSQRARAIVILPRSEARAPFGDDAEPAPISLRAPPLISRSCRPHHQGRAMRLANIPEPLPFGIRRPPDREHRKLSHLELLCFALAISALLYLGSLGSRTEDPWLKAAQAELQTRPLHPLLAAVADPAPSRP